MGALWQRMRREGVGANLVQTYCLVSCYFDCCVEMFCANCGTEGAEGANFCSQCGKEFGTASENPKKNALKPGGAFFGRAKSFLEYKKMKGKEWKERVPKKGGKNKAGSDGKEEKDKDVDVMIQIGLMEWSEKYVSLKPKYGKRLALRVPKTATYTMIFKKATEKWKNFQSNLYSEDEEYVLLLDDCKEALFMPGSSKEFFNLKNYQEEVGKDFKRIVLYLCTQSDFKLHTGSGQETDSEKSNESEPEVIPIKKPRVDDEGSLEEIDGEEKSDAENDKKNDASSTQSAIKITSRKTFKDTKEVVMELKSRVDKSSDLHVVARRGISFERLISLWCRAAGRHSPEFALKVSYLGEDGNDSGALAQEFLASAIAEMGTKLFKDGSPIESTHYVQNGTYMAAGELSAVSIANGGPPPNFLQDCVFDSLLNTEIDLLSPESHLTANQKELLNNIKKDVNNNTEVIIDNGYTGYISQANIKDISRSVAVNMLSKRILYLKEFKEGLKLFGLSNIISSQPELCRELFVIGKVKEVDANYFLAHLNPDYSPECSTRRALEEQAMDHFQDLLISIEDEEQTPEPCAINWNDSRSDDEDMYGEDLGAAAKQFVTPEISPAGVMGWITGKRHRDANGQETKILVKFDHDCLIRDPKHTICFPVVSACAMQITLPLQHMKTSEEFKNVFLLGYNKGQAFARK